MNECLQDPERVYAEGVVGIGSVVAIHFTDEPLEDTELIQIVGRHDDTIVDKNIQKVSIDSPLGAVILGAEVGSVISYSVSDHETARIVSVKIIAVS